MRGSKEGATHDDGGGNLHSNDRNYIPRMRLLNQALDRALAAPETGTAVEWSNAATGAGGAITPLRAFDQSGRPCREVKVVNRHRQLESSGVYTLCRSEGLWKLAQ